MLKALQGFKDFITRGNVVDLAVGIVIGAAFSTVVSSLTDSFFTPLIRAISGGSTEVAGTWVIRGQKVDWAAFVNALISFTITAAVIYFLIVTPMNRFVRRRGVHEELPEQTRQKEVELLTEIRDALVKQGRPQQRVDQP